MDRQELEFIQDQIGYRFQNPDLLQQAFVRRSYAQENGGEDNEVLEFIGDKVLDLIVVKLLVQQHGYMLRECDGYDPAAEFDEFACGKNEAELTEIKKTLTQKKTLAQRIEVLSLADYLIMGKGDIRKKADREDSVREDLFEAILGAVAIDCGWDMETLQGTVEIMLDPDSILCRDDPDNYVSIIHDWFTGEYGRYPEFRYEALSRFEQSYVKERIAYDSRCRSVALFGAAPADHKCIQPNYRCRLRLPEREFVGYGASKSLARKDVCELLYAYLEENGLLRTIRDEIDHPNRDEAISQLEILARRGYFTIPVYDFSQSYDADGNPVWKSVCRIPEQKRSFSAGGASKKEAKKAAAYEMLKHVLNS